MSAPEEEALGRLLDILDRAAIPYMIVGSFASNLYGVPRATQDADVVVEISASSLKELLPLLERDFYVSADAAREAITWERSFNAIHYDTAFKVDLIVRKDRAYSREEFRRRRRFEVFARERWFASAEDTILSKLEWAKMGQSERQFRDAVAVARVQGASLDMEYLRKWAQVLDVEHELNRLLSLLADSR